MSLSATHFIDRAEAAYIADVSEGDIDHFLAEQILPDSLARTGENASIARLATPFIAFYFRAEQASSVPFRRQVIETIAERIVPVGTQPSETSPSDADLQFGHDNPAQALVDLKAFFNDARARAKLVDHALRCIASEQSILRGLPVFRGTRIPIDSILATLDEGSPFERITDSYPNLTPELIEAARVYWRVRPRRGRTPTLAELNPTWILLSKQTGTLAST